MSIPIDAAELLNREFFEVRGGCCKWPRRWIGWTARRGTCRRTNAGEGSMRRLTCWQGAGPGGTEKLQMIFSLPYERKWKEKFKMTNGRAAE